MAADEKTAEKTPKDKASPYTVAMLAADLGIEPASARVALRNAGIEKSGKKYEWSTKTEYQKVLSALKKKPAKADKE